jgi:hypothetical protein
MRQRVIIAETDVHILVFFVCLFIYFLGKETGGSSVATKTEESAVTEERIAHILHEASAALRAQQVDDSGSDESKPPSQTQVYIKTILLLLMIIIKNQKKTQEQTLHFYVHI